MWYGVRKLRRASGIPGLWVVECLINWEYEDSKDRKHGIAAKAPAQSEVPIAMRFLPSRVGATTTN